MAKYTSGRQKNLKIGISSYSEDLTSLEVIGRVGIGTTNAIANLQVDGSVKLGRTKTDLINVPGSFSSNLNPDGDGVYDIGRAPQIGLGANRWKDANFYGKGVFDGGIDAHDIEIGVGSANLIYSTSGNLELNAQSGKTRIDDIVIITGNVGVGTENPTSKLWVNGDGYFTGIVTANRIFSSVYGEFTASISAGAIVGTALSISGISTLGITSTTLLTAEQLNVIGVTSTNSLSIGSTQVISSARQLQNISSLDSTTIATIESAIVNAPNTFVDLQVTGVSTFTNGPVLIGTGNSTGVPSTILQVVGINSSVYVGGNMGIGTINPTCKLQVQGDVLVSGIITCNDFNSASDFNLKKNIKPFENALDKVIHINGVTFEWKKNNSQSAGIIAQDVEKVFPELVRDGEFKTVNYNGLIGVLVESIKELKQEVQNLKIELNDLKYK